MKLLVTYFFAALLSATALSSHAAAPAAPAAPAKVVKPDLVAGEAKFTAACAACHGADGNSGTPVNPKLAQQHPEYLVKQLQEFKAGIRKNAVMQGFASQLSDADMKNIAFWAASKKIKPGFANDKELVAWVSAFTVAAWPTGKSPPALAATAPMVRATRCNTLA